MRKPLLTSAMKQKRAVRSKRLRNDIEIMKITSSFFLHVSKVQIISITKHPSNAWSCGVQWREDDFCLVPYFLIDDWATAAYNKQIQRSNIISWLEIKDYQNADYVFHKDLNPLNCSILTHVHSKAN